MGLSAAIRRTKEGTAGPVRASGSRSVLAYLFSRLGFECGRFARELHKTSKISWGTYADSLCHEGQLHCNAHANNIAIVPPGESTDAYLSYLDLDMAFDRETFVDTWKSGKVGRS